MNFSICESKRPAGVYLLGFFCFGIQFISFLYLGLYVLGDDALIS